MTFDEARQIIETYTRDRAPYNGYTLWGDANGERVQGEVLYKDKRVKWFPLTAGETSFQRGEATGEYVEHSRQSGNVTLRWRYPLMRVVDVQYQDIGELYTSYTGLNAVTPFTAFIVGPTILWPFQGADDNSGVAALEDMRWMLQPWSMKAKLMSFIPLWLVGVPLWMKTQEEELAEALMFMRARQNQL